MLGRKLKKNNTLQQIHTNEYIELVLSKPTTTTSMITKGIDKYATAAALYTQHTTNNVVAKESSRRRNPERFISRTLIRRNTFAYKKAKQSKKE